MDRRTLPEPKRTSPVLVCGLTALVLAFAASPAQAAGRWLFEGLLDAEIEETDAASRLLSKNGGDPLSNGTLQLWAAAEFHPRLQLMVLGQFEGTTADDESGVESEIEQAFLRYSIAGNRPLFLEAGRIVTPIGDFPPRYLSTQNPLIGAPTGYDVAYPLGVQLAGSVSLFDFRAAVIDSPLTNESYVPPADNRARPAVAVGVTPFVGLRLGGYYTRGSYLNEELEADLPAGTDWKDLTQDLVGLDGQFSRGHFEIHADYNVSTYEVPPNGEVLQGNAFYVEPKYTWTPRFYTALRLETNEYVFSRKFGDFWVGRETRVDDVEIGAGYRFGRDTLLKMSYRLDHWDVDGEDAANFPNGHSFALQLSQAFDVRGWFEAPR